MVKNRSGYFPSLINRSFNDVLRSESSFSPASLLSTLLSIYNWTAMFFSVCSIRPLFLSFWHTPGCGVICLSLPYREREQVRERDREREGEKRAGIKRCWERRRKQEGWQQERPNEGETNKKGTVGDKREREGWQKRKEIEKGSEGQNERERDTGTNNEMVIVLHNVLDFFMNGGAW